MIGGAFLVLAVAAILVVCLWADKYDDYPDTASRPAPLGLRAAAEPQKPQRGPQKRGSAPQEPHPRRKAPAPTTAKPRRRLKYWEIEDLEIDVAATIAQDQALSSPQSTPYASHPALPFFDR